jgi:hypothetical protein
MGAIMTKLFMLLLLTLSAHSYAQSSEQLLGHKLLTNIEEQADELFSLNQGGECLQETQAREKACQLLGQIKGGLDIGIQLYRPTHDASLEELQVFPHVMSSHFFEASLHVNRILKSCGSEDKFVRSLLSAHISHFQGDILASLKRAREALAGKRCTNERFVCPLQKP